MPRENRKNLIEQTAIRLFSEQGILETTIKDIASAAGMSEAALYRHYKSKEEMAWTLFLRELQKFTDGFGERLRSRSGQPLAERLRSAVEYALVYSAEQPESFAFILLTRHSFKEDIYNKQPENPLELLSRVLEEAMQNGELIPEPAGLLTAMIMGIILTPVELLRYRGGLQRYELDETGRERIIQGCIALLRFTDARGK